MEWVNISVCIIRSLHSLDHEFLDCRLDFGNSSLGVEALSNNEMNRRIPALLSSLDCLFSVSNSFLDVKAMQVDFIRCAILIVLYWNRQIGLRVYYSWSGGTYHGKSIRSLDGSKLPSLPDVAYPRLTVPWREHGRQTGRLP